MTREPTIMAGGAVSPRARSAARRRALDILYEADVLDQPIAVVLARYLHRAAESGGVDAATPDAYTVELVQGVDRLGGGLDERIRDAAEHWRLERMPLVDRNVLRLATYELVDRGEVPTSVVISEAVELAKLLSTDDSGRFVNGVLAAIARVVRRPAAGGTPRGTSSG